MDYTYSKLRGRIVEKYKTISNFSKQIKRSEVSVSNKLNLKSGFSQEDIELWAKVLEIKFEDYGIYFFT